MTYYNIGNAVGYLSKAAQDELSYSLSGILKLSKNGWLILSVPYSLVRGAMDAIHEVGVELPDIIGIPVMSPIEINKAGGSDSIKERGHSFSYTMASVRSNEPYGLSKSWYIKIYSPELRKLRLSYNLPEYPVNSDCFKLTIGVRRLNATSKVKQAESFNLDDYNIDKLAKVSFDPDPGFAPDYSVKDLKDMGVYSAMYEDKGPRLASSTDWKPEWFNPSDPKGWLQWYDRYTEGRRIDDDDRQIKRWKSFKARHGAQLKSNPTPRRAFALQNWGIDPTKLIDDSQAAELLKQMAEYKNKKITSHKKNKGE